MGVPRLGLAMAALLTVGVNGGVSAQSPLQLRGGIGLTTTEYDQETVDRLNLAGRGWGTQATFAPRFFNYASLLVEFGFEMWFQLCIEQNCERDRTSTSSIMASLGGGLSTPILFVDDPQGRVGFGLFVHGGHEWIDAGLSTDNCLNCTIDDLDVDGGYWLEGGLDLVADPTVTIGFAYRVYEPDSEMESRITIRIIGYR